MNFSIKPDSSLRPTLIQLYIIMIIMMIIYNNDLMRCYFVVEILYIKSVKNK